MLIVFCLIACGCAGPSTNSEASLAKDGLPASWELSDTPFFPQEEYQCGPAALATVLSASGLQLVPEDISRKVYLPERRGSLQLELVAATRRYGRLPYLLDPSLRGLQAELLAGRPVLVFQNLGLRSLPIWHYAVVIGYDQQREQLILRSGDQYRHILSTKDFLRSWALSDYWAMVALRPGELPGNPDESRYLEGVVALESVAPAETSLAFYEAAVVQWPGSVLAWFGLGNAQYATGDYKAAKATFANLLSMDADHAAARHNLAYLLAQEGCYQDAMEELDKALASAGEASVIQRQLLQTRREILGMREPGMANAETCQPGRLRR